MMLYGDGMARMSNPERCHEQLTVRRCLDQYASRCTLKDCSRYNEYAMQCARIYSRYTPSFAPAFMCLKAIDVDIALLVCPTYERIMPIVLLLAMQRPKTPSLRKKNQSKGLALKAIP